MVSCIKVDLDVRCHAGSPEACTAHNPARGQKSGRISQGVLSNIAPIDDECVLSGSALPCLSGRPSDLVGYRLCGAAQRAQLLRVELAVLRLRDAQCENDK